MCARYGGHCAYCNAYVGMRGTIDHYLPQALGGSDDEENLRWACPPCNNKKGQMHPSDWEKVKPAVARVRNPRQEKIELLQLIAQRQRERANT